MNSAVEHDPLVDARMRVDTPEQVAFDLPLAGLGSRFVALWIDLVILGVAMLSMLFVALLVMHVSRTAALLFVLVGAFVAVWGWFFLFEAFADGATPGKRITRLRVVRTNGESIDVTAAALRNLLRIIDLQPGLSGLVGGSVMLSSSRYQRLGDLAAGTVVVRDLPHALPPPPSSAPGGSGRPELSDGAFDALERFLVRRAGLSREAAAKLTAQHLAALGFAGGTLDDLVALHAAETERRAGADAVSNLSAVALVRSRHARWRAFQREVDRLGARGFRALDDESASRFAAGLRAVSTDLARARTLRVGIATRWALERLVARAHSRFHRHVRRGTGSFIGFVRGGLARAVRRHRAAVVAALIAFYAPAVVSGVLVASDPSLEPILVGAEMARRADQAAGDPSLDYRDTISSAFAGGELLAGMLLVNNLGVAFFAFASGAFAGVGSLFLLVFNGVHLGAAMGAFSQRGVLDNLSAWIAPHGPFELTAICLAGAAGFVLGSAVWAPGRVSRAQAFAERGRDAFGLLAGAALLLVGAALLEGYVAPARVAPAVKYATGIACTVLLVLYFAAAGRPPRVRLVTAPRDA